MTEPTFDWSRDGHTYSGTRIKKKQPTQVTVEGEYSKSLEDKLALAWDALAQTDSNPTVLMLFEDMFDINEHFQAVLDWFKERGIPLTTRGRWQQGCRLTRGWLYFCPAQTHVVPTKGVAAEIDLRDEAEELVRKTGLDARLRAKGAA
jgi:hypothetical protein